MPSRRIFIASSLASAALGLEGCAGVTNALNNNGTIHSIVGSAQVLDRAVIGTRGDARVYRDSDVVADFRVNSLATPTSGDYSALEKDRFANYVMPVTGLVDKPEKFTLRELRALQSIDQATRHDCVEGWSEVGRWSGVVLGKLLALVRPKPEARYVVFYSFDRDEQGTPYYGSLGIVQAMHPQTQLALDLNGKPLDADHGAPVRLKVPTQLGYKSTKWVQRIEITSTLAGIYGGQGGYWEDNGYEWYAGI